MLPADFDPLRAHPNAPVGLHCAIPSNRRQDPVCLAGIRLR